ncbi:MAG: pyruvate kinase [Candidatus Paceibacterota bacterium]
MTSKAQIIATIGPSSASRETLFAMIEHQVDVIRLNFSWGDHAEKAAHIELIRQAEQKFGRRIPIVQDLPGPRVQETHGHKYDPAVLSAFTAEDKEHLRFGLRQKIDYVALSFVGSAGDVKLLREAIKEFGGHQPIIAKIERRAAVEAIDEIIAAADAVMIARGDLGNEVPLEQIPFIQASIIKKCKAAGKPVITATGMLISMTHSTTPARAEVTDVANDILQGSDAVMLSDETASGKHPVAAVAMMEKIVIEAERHMGKGTHFNTFT